MATLNKFNLFTQDLGEKVHNLKTDTLKIMLTDVAPVASNHVKTDITEIAAGNGYVAGGAAAAYVSDNSSGGVYKLILSPVSWTASGGSITQFRYAVLYNSSAASQQLIGWYDYGAEFNLTNGNTFTVNLDQTNGVFTVT